MFVSSRPPRARDVALTIVSCCTLFFELRKMKKMKQGLFEQTPRIPHFMDAFEAAAL